MAATKLAATPDLVPVPRTTETDLTMGVCMLKGIFSALDRMEGRAVEGDEYELGCIRAELILAGKKIAKDLTDRM